MTVLGRGIVGAGHVVQRQDEPDRDVLRGGVMTLRLSSAWALAAASG